MEITAKMVKDLREKTAAGMMDCKKALEEVAGDMEKAVDWLRQKGLSKAAKREGRATSEGCIACHIVENKNAVLVELCCETDFVTRGDTFQNFVKETLHTFHTSGKHSLEREDVQESITAAIATTGENITLGKSVRYIAADNGYIGSYVHANGKIAVLVEVTATKPATLAKQEFVDFVKNVAMQIAAANPLSLDSADLDPAQVERERDVYRQKARDEGKAENIIEKIAEGAVQKYFKEVCLLDQPYIRDDKQNVRDLLKATSKAVDDTLTVTRFVRLQLGGE